MFKIKCLIIILLILTTSCASLEDSRELEKEKYKDVISEKETYKKMPKVEKYTKAERDRIIEELLQWVNERNISIVGVNKTFAEIYETGLDENNYVDPRNISRTVEIAEGLYKLPEDLIQVMNGKTAYISTKDGRGHVILGTSPYLNRGFIVEQPVTDYDVLHEFAHVLDSHGIKGVLDDPQNHWAYLLDERNEIFRITEEYDPNRRAPSEGYITVYSMHHQDENFAEHFTAYVINANQFREKAQDQPLLKQKYDFFKNSIFNGREY